MTIVRLALLSTLLALPALAQEGGPEDSITWVDGTKTMQVRVQAFNLREIKFVHKGNNETKPAETVANISSKKAHDTFKQGYGTSGEDAAGKFLDAARKLVKTDPFQAQIGFIEAARQALAASKEDEAFQIARELTDAVADTGFMGECWRMRIEHYLGAGSPADVNNAKEAADNYSKAATTQGWPDFYLNDAEFYKIMAKAVGGKSTPPVLQNELRALFTKVESSSPLIAQRCQVQIGNSLLQEKKVDEAKKTFETLLDKNLDKTTFAIACVGLGNALMEQGDPTKRDAYRQALLAYLRVWTNASDAGAEIVAEALYKGAKAAEAWNDKDCAFMSGRLKSYLRKDFVGTKWEKELSGR